jgi:hypothetical protein
MAKLQFIHQGLYAGISVQLVLVEVAILNDQCGHAIR